MLDNIDPDVNHYGDYSVNFTSYDIDSLKTNINLDDGFNLLHHNSRSLLAENRMVNYEVLLDSINNPFHILGLSETWLKPENVNDVEFDDYDHIYIVRPIDGNNDNKETGGGLSFFIRKGVDFRVCENMKVVQPFMESLFIEVCRNNKTYMIGLIYRVPNTNIDSFIDKVNELIEPIKNKHEVILLGDFNIDLLQDNKYSRDFQNMLQSNYLAPTILDATRVASVNRNGENQLTETLIDNIFINRCTDFKSGLIYSSITDHYPIFTTILDNSPPTNNEAAPKTTQSRLINDFKIRKFKSALQISFLSSLQNIENAQQAFTNFFEIFNSLYDKYFPVITKIVKEKSLLKPWVSESLVQRIKIRDNLGRKYNKGKIDRDTFTRFRNKLTSQLRTAKSNYYKSEFAKYHGNGKKTWAIINSNIRKKIRPNVVKLKVNEDILNTEEVPNKFIDYFSNIASQLASDVAPSDKDAASYLKDRNLNSFFVIPIVNKEVEIAITQLKSSSSLLSISSAVLDSVKDVISQYLSQIFNLCLNQGYFPDELKLGRITPIHKKGCKFLVNNYRPVCNLSPFSKIFEKIVYNRMLEYIQKYNIFSSTQFGFRKEMGTETALVEFTEFIHNGLNKKHNIGSIFMDLSKAFDVMDHRILKDKLEHYGFRGKFLDFLMSFLIQRKYFVYVNGFRSDIKTVNIGVPQGSTLGPLLFLIFINDMKNCSLLLKFIQFADDTTILFSSNDINILNEILEREANKVILWFNANKLIINVSKTSCMLFSNKRNTPQLNITLNDSVLEVQTETTFLGVVIDNKLSWKAHISHISGKLSRSIAIIRLLRYSFPKKVLRMIYMSLIFSHINYCNLIWGSAKKTILEPLFKLQKKAVRLVNNSHYLEHTDPIFDSLNILTIHKVFKLNCLIFIYKCLKKDKFPDFKNRFIKNSEFHSYSTRNNHQYRIPLERLEICRNSYFVQGLTLWNVLDDKEKLNNNFDIFKKNIKKLLLKNKFSQV